MKRTVLTVLAPLAGLATTLSGMGVAHAGHITDTSPSPARCTSLQGTTVGDLKISTSTHRPGTGELPAHCRVEGTITTRGVAGEPDNEVGVAVALPDRWRGDLHFLGVGGFAGVIGDLGPALARGYAAASTDTGHSGSPADASWARGSRTAAVDFGHRATHVATVAAKALAGNYYGRGPRWSVFEGCSNGGRQGIMEAVRYPRDYDAVISRDPARAVIEGATTWTWNSQAILKPGGWLSPAEVAKLDRLTQRVNDAKDGARDGLIWDPRNARVTSGQLRAAGFTPPQIAAIRKVQDGPLGLGPASRPMQPVGHESGWAANITGRTAPARDASGRLGWTGGGPISFNSAGTFLSSFIYEDPDYDLRDFDFPDDVADLASIRNWLDVSNPDMGTYLHRGGKLMFIQDWADPSVSAYGNLRYFQSVRQQVGAATADHGAGLYMVPGAYHCGGGPGPHDIDALSAMENWLATGKRPQALVGTTETGARHHLCAWRPGATIRHDSCRPRS